MLCQVYKLHHFYETVWTEAILSQNNCSTGIALYTGIPYSQEMCVSHDKMRQNFMFNLEYDFSNEFKFINFTSCMCSDCEPICRRTSTTVIFCLQNKRVKSPWQQFSDISRQLCIGHSYKFYSTRRLLEPELNMISFYGTILFFCGNFL